VKMNTSNFVLSTATQSLLAAVLATACVAGCATTPKQAAKGATEGALEEVKEQAQPRGPNDTPPMQDLASSIVKGTASALDEPETRAQLGRVIETTTRTAIGSVLGEFTGPRWGNQWGDTTQRFGPGPSAATTGPLGPVSPLGALGGKLSEGFTLGMSRQLQIELGPNGEGPLGQTMAGVMRQATRAAVAGVTEELAPADCAGLDSRECTDRRIRDLSASAAKGLVDGLGAALHVPLLIGAFGAGMAGAVIVLLLLRLRRPVLVADGTPINTNRPLTSGRR
jgi:hypothetical protein